MRRQRMRRFILRMTLKGFSLGWRRPLQQVNVAHKGRIE